MTPIGHREQLAAFRAAIGQGRMHHAWLLAGPQGVGKAMFAQAAAARYLAEGTDRPPAGPGLDVAEDHPTAKLIAAGSHPDYRQLARLPRDKTGDLARNITIDQVRGLQPFFSVTPSMSARRTVIIDAIDDLERPAANALLKNLEEPPADTLFLLVSHSPGRLLPTIRSRCRLLRFGALDDGDMGVALRRLLPGASDTEIAALVASGGGAPGRALRFAGLDISAIDSALLNLARDGDPSNAQRMALAKALALKAAQPRYEIFLERLPAFIAAQAKAREGAALARAIELWEKARRLAETAVRLSLDPQTTVFELATLVAALAPGADRAKA
ncbi:DNA polymerase-3 subunit delta' [Sphingomonas laterariae]|uniref:DNA polymerase-3 subunit delta n=1 Tax=Edaphosphingomonas laterariae TaxID=861865 RepID=A0A239B9W4_9SPHN|nr:AAA family ATPase [Sphingomonas laterariae]SNS04736.1 DNA polymerase-3 subunit delta' [Sphingomonas laterariae]